MGLDSVELVMDIEKFFGMMIAEEDAARTSTVGEMTDLVSRHLQVVSDEPILQKEIFEELIPLIQPGMQPGKDILLTDKVADYFNPSNKIHWKQVEQALRLTIPVPDGVPYSLKPAWKQMLNIVAATANYEWNSITFDRFADCIGGANYRSVVNPRKLRSKHDVYIAVMGITVDKTGVEYFEVLPEKRFTDDLGID